MPDAYPKICFKFSGNGGSTIRVWGRVDGGVELSAGWEPDVVNLRCPKVEFAKFAEVWQQTGSLELYWSDPDTPDVTLAGWSIDHVADSLSGSIAGGGWEVVEKIVTITDRRWELTGGRGGWVNWGRFNTPTKDGLAVENVPKLFNNANGLSHGAIIYALGGALHYASGLTAWDPEAYPPLMTTLPKPRDLNYDGKLIPEAMREIIEDAGCVWSVDTAGKYILMIIGQETGDPIKGIPAGLRLAALPAGDRLPNDTSEPRSTRQSALVITSAPQRIIQQECVAGTDWDWVGMDRDGSLKLMADIQYVKDTGKTPAQLARRHFADLSAADATRARFSFFKIIRLNNWRDLRLPWTTRLTDVVTDGTTVTVAQRAVGIKIEMRQTSQRADGAFETTTALVEQSGFSVDPIAGTITFPERKFKLEGDAVYITPDSWIEQLAGADFQVTIAYESTSYRTYEDYYNQAYHLLGGVVTSITMADAMNPTTTPDVRVVKMPELQAYRDGNGNVGNDAQLKAITDSVAARLLGPVDEIEVRRYVGFKHVSPSGAVPKVRWDFAAGQTILHVQTWHVDRERFDARSLFRKLADTTRGAKTDSTAAPQRNQDGRRDWAVPSPVWPGSADREAQTFALLAQYPDCYDAASAHWTDYATDKKLARYCRATTYDPVAGNSTNGVNVWLEFWDPEYANEIDRTGAREVPTDCILAYIPIRGRTVNGQAMDGIVLCCHGIAGTYADPCAALPTAANVETEAAQTDTWDVYSPPASTWGLDLAVVTRVSYNEAGDKTLYGYRRTLQIDSSGRLIGLSAETRYTIDAPVVCA